MTMCTVKQIPSPREFIVINSGYVKSIKPLTLLHFEYWLEWAEPDGSLTNVWSGETYAAAEPGCACEQGNGVALRRKPMCRRTGKAFFAVPTTRRAAALPLRWAKSEQRA